MLTALSTKSVLSVTSWLFISLNISLSVAFACVFRSVKANVGRSHELVRNVEIFLQLNADLNRDRNVLDMKQYIIGLVDINTCGISGASIFIS